MLSLAKERLPDLTEFYTTGEGFASWNHKVALWTQHRPQYHYPEIELKLGKDNSPSLLDPSVVPYIALQANMSSETIGQMINVDIDALRAQTSSIFIDEFSPPTSITLAKKPRQFCLTCFSNALLQKQIPCFDPYWQGLWATHCVKDGSPLMPILSLIHI